MIWRAIQRGVDARGVSEPLTLCLTLIFSSLVALITLEGCDGTVEIPMFGSKHSHNVATAAGIILSEVRRQWLQPKGERTRRCTT